jgi:hypothetical protein
MPNNALKTFLHIPSLRCYPSFGRIFLRSERERESKRALGVGLRRMRRCRQGAYSHSRPLAQHSTVGSLHPSCELLCPRFARRVSERERETLSQRVRERRDASPAAALTRPTSALICATARLDGRQQAGQLLVRLSACWLTKWPQQPWTK